MYFSLGTSSLQLSITSTSSVESFSDDDDDDDDDELILYLSITIYLGAEEELFASDSLLFFVLLTRFQFFFLFEIRFALTIVVVTVSTRFASEIVRVTV